MTEQDLHYLKSILGNLREFRTSASVRKVGLTIGTEILSDNIDWLDCFIDRAMKGDRPRRGFSSPGFEQGMQSEWDAQLAKAVTAEREACARVAEWFLNVEKFSADDIAERIRVRGTAERWGTNLVEHAAYKHGVTETIERCAQKLEELGARYHQGHDLPAAIRAMGDKK